MKTRQLPRPRIQRAFVRWLISNKDRFNIAVEILKISATKIDLHFKNQPRCISTCLSKNSLGVYVEWQGEYWDQLIDLAVCPTHTTTGYQCKCCLNEEGPAAEVFLSREALWIDHLFEPFLKWVNERLFNANWLRVSCLDDGGATWAELVKGSAEISASSPTTSLLKNLKKLNSEPQFANIEESTKSWLIPLGDMQNQKD